MRSTLAIAPRRDLDEFIDRYAIGSLQVAPSDARVAC
jgi:hypothetical protein